MKILLFSVLVFLCFPPSNSILPPKINVGSVFLEDDQEVHRAFRLGIDSLPNRNLLNGTSIEFDIQYAQTDDFFHLYTRACLEVNYGIISLFGPNDKNLDLMLESISSNLGVPYISTAPRPVLTNVQTESKIRISLHPTQAQMIELIKDLVRELQWKEAAIIHDPEHGIIQPSLLAESLQFLGPISVHSVSVDLRATLVQLRLRGARNIIIDTSSQNLDSVTKAALDTGMMTKPYTYIFTVLDMKYGNWSRLAYSQALVFGFNLIDERKFQEFQDRFASMPSGQMGLEDTVQVALTLDSVELLARGLEAFDNSGTEFTLPSTITCAEEKKWELGEELIDAFSSVSFDGLTGPISISSGTRMKLFVEILKLNYEFGLEGPVILKIGNWTQGISYEYEGILIDDKAQLTNEQPVINKTLVISTIENNSCYSKLDSGEEQGYCVEMAQQLAKLVGFNYKFKVVGDGLYGKADGITGFWDGMIGEVKRGDADLALADLTITTERSRVVDFSIPFHQTSLGILYKNDGELNTDEMGTLLSPFSFWVWISILVAFFVTSICLRFVAWLSPIQKQEMILASSERATDSDRLSLANSMWVLASSLVLRGTDIRIKALSSRTIAVVWWLFALLVLIVYASLVSNWLQPEAKSFRPQSLEMLLQKQQLEFGFTQSSSTSHLLEHAQNENLQKIWWKIQKSGVERSTQETIGQGIGEVQDSNGNYAFITEETYLNQALSQDCSLRILSGIAIRSFGIALQKGSPLRDRISQGILTLSETGVLKRLEEKWWPRSECTNDRSKPKLTLLNFIGPLTLLSTGIILAIFIAMGERIGHYRRNHRGFFRTHIEAGNGKIAMNDTESDE